MPPAAKKNSAPRRSITGGTKAANVAGRDDARVVKAYLDALASVAPKKRGRKRTAESIERRLEAIEARLPSAPALTRLQLIQERADLQAERQAMNEKAALNLDELRKEFIKRAKAYGEQKGIRYATWREAGVDPATLREAGISRTP